MSEEKTTPGGRGGRPSATAQNLDCRRLKDLRLIKRALQGGWPVSTADRPIIVDKVMGAASDEALGPRHRITALECLVLMVEQNHTRMENALESVLDDDPC